MKYVSPLTKSTNTVELYVQKSIPLFQNKIYKTLEESINIEKVDVKLVQCQDTGFVFSGGFDMNKLNYDENYQNEQANSDFFKSHLEDVFQLLKKHNLLNGKVLEIGCGKGYFLDLLLKENIDIIGIDPTYEGESDKVIKEYYSEKYSYLNAELIILRHTLEHIPTPFDFIKMIAKSANYQGKIYIEIPTFDWIYENNTIEDVFYEHCNYFTPNTISQLFEECEVSYIFNRQYIGIIADLSKVKNKISPIQSIEKYDLKFAEKFNELKRKIDNLKNIAIWGAGAKGSTFLNLLDVDRTKIKCVIDINEKKQDKYIGGTGHYIISPNDITNYNIDNIIVMNINYINEIKNITNINLITL